MEHPVKRRHRVTRPPRGFQSVLAFLGTILVVAAVNTAAAPASSADLNVGDTVHVGSKQGYGGTGLYPLYEAPPATGTPDYWSYCIEHDVSARVNTTGVLGEFNSYLGSNYFTSTAVQGKVLWVLAHSYPALSLADFGTAIGVPNIARNDAIEATQYAIWRYTDLNYDANWNFETPDSGTAYWYLVNGANASTGLTPADLVVTATITPPAAAAPDSLVGPFIVHTNQPTASVSATGGFAVTDATGIPIDTSTVVDGQQVYLDLRGTSTAGSATVTVSASGSSATGKVISVPATDGGTPTAGSHAQSIILVTPDTTTTDDDATVTWTAVAAPQIATTLVDDLDGDKNIVQA
ncbi:TQXA domain-containing protein, partial [Nakamurella silvestris]